MYSPNSDLYLVNTLFAMGDEHQLIFSDSTSQTNYFLSLQNLYLTSNNGYTYIRKDHVIRVNKNIETLYNYNYVMYRNTQFTDKWFYAFISELVYINEQITEVHIKTDVIQTWWFDLTFNASFIERQTPSKDSLNTIADSVAHGQLIETRNKTFSYSGGYFCFCSGNVLEDDATKSTTYSFTIGYKYTIPCMVLFWTEDQASSMSKAIQAIGNKGRGDRILSLVYVPFLGDSTIKWTKFDKLNNDLGEDIYIATEIEGIEGLRSNENYDLSDEEVTYLKAMTYPYAKIVVEDTATGQSIELAPEKFANLNVTFQIQVTISQTPTLKVIPTNYEGQALAYNHMLVTQCNTTLTTMNNTYANYMMQNKQINDIARVSAGIGIVGSVATGSAMGVISGAEQIINIAARENQASKIPNQVTAITDGAMERLLYNNGIKISLFMMDRSHMDLACNYWDAVGYPVNQIAMPNIHTEGQTHNFIKMVSPNIEGGNIPSNDMREIEGIFTKGVTLWHDSTQFKKY